MAAKQNNSEPAGDLSDIKRKLIWRMGIAGLMIIALLGGLALFDHFTSRNEEEVPAPQFTEPVPVAKKTVTQPVTPVEAAPVAEEATPEASAAPVDKSAPALDLPARPEVSAQPKLPKPSSPTGHAPVTATRAVPASAGAVRSEAPAPVAALPVSPAPPRLLSGFALQAGVFSDPRRAEELHAKLTLEGIPSSIESRVQVGPFKRKEDAEAARAKMKALGIDAVLLPPVKTAKPR